MKITLVGIYDRGIIKSERIHFRANTPIDLKFYAILDTNYLNPGAIAAGQQKSYWFVSKVINSGENIVLYTRSGTSNEESRPDGSKFHFLFRGLSTAIYSNSMTTAAIFEINDWATVPPV